MATAPTPACTITGALADELIALETDVMFGLVGEDTLGFVTAASQAGVAYHGARHENIAVGMADGYSWRGGGLGVCTVTRGPGLLNAAMAIRTAARAGRRVLVITGDMATDGDWDWDFKSIDHAPLVAALGAAYFHAPTPDDVVPVFRRAAEAARRGRTVVFAVPVDVLHAPAAAAAVGREPGLPEVRQTAPEPTAEAIAHAVELLGASEKPLILAGRGAQAPEVRPVLEQLALRTGALLGTTLLARELFRGSPYDVGIVGGFSSDPAVPLLAEVDCAVVFGASLNRWTTAGRTLFKDVPVIQVDSDPAALGANMSIEVEICADAGVAAARLLDALSASGVSSKPFHRPETLERLRRPLWAGPDESTEDELDPRAITTTLDQLLPEERTIVLDSGRHLTSAGRFMRFLGPDSFRHTADGGAIGMGLGIALGAKAASPETPAVLFIGDGGMSMTLGDLETAVRNDLPLTIVVMNDRAYGSELVHAVADGLPWDHATLPEIDFAAAAAALGLEAARVRTLEELRTHARNLEGRTTSLLLDCRIRQDLFVRRVSW
jgi:acetolactate synthase-1/2/3 large subunit